MPKDIRLITVIKCPVCKFRIEEIMPADTCQSFYTCPECSAHLKPKPGDCCVFTSYGSLSCPSVQMRVDGGCIKLDKRK